jgi:hypothetical protein
LSKITQKRENAKKYYFQAFFFSCSHTIVNCYVLVLKPQKFVHYTFKNKFKKRFLHEKTYVYPRNNRKGKKICLFSIQFTECAVRYSTKFCADWGIFKHCSKSAKMGDGIVSRRQRVIVPKMRRSL